ncbi:hypothetical protein GCM10011352_40860 [Marinobacterium zhoushanense]|uniref:Uncharacterized protein n=1 Tax=Marinobacterium zhoushanense TaxID=1679163 RepID=A0ABQ1KTW0_9GAMM|nr:hypothetical protein GCM10011352_40860 [Marinobacterium zhoushanense]
MLNKTMPPRYSKAPSYDEAPFSSPPDFYKVYRGLFDAGLRKRVHCLTIIEAHSFTKNKTGKLDPNNAPD